MTARPRLSRAPGYTLALLSRTCTRALDNVAGTSAPGPGDYMMTSWRHLECMTKLPKGLSSVSEIQGLGSLEPADVQRVKDWYEELAAKLAIHLLSM